MDIDFCGEIIKLNCRPEDEDYCGFLAERLRTRAAEAAGNHPAILPMELLLLVAMALADELHGREYAPPDRPQFEGGTAAAEREALMNVFRQL